jgi:hypothetical protein
MAYAESIIIEIIEKIERAVLNPTTIHPLDERRVEQLFHDTIIKYGLYDEDDIIDIVSRLGSKYRNYTRMRISSIAGSKIPSYQV